MSATQHGLGPIVVGVDGSEPSRRALEWAAREAALHGRPLTVLHTYQWPITGGFVAPDIGATPEIAENIVREATARVVEIAPGVPVTGEVMVNAPAAELLERSATAAMIVVGNRGHGGFAGLLVGSVGVHVSAHAQCPVAVVRPSVAQGGDVVVGVDGSDLSQDAVEYAFEEASLRGAGLTVAHAWTVPVSSGPGDMVPLLYDTTTTGADEERVLAEAVSGWQTKYPDVSVRRLVVHGPPGEELVRLSDGAALVVVGARGRGGFRGLLLGSVSQTLIHHCASPVLVVRTAAER